MTEPTTCHWFVFDGLRLNTYVPDREILIFAAFERSWHAYVVDIFRYGRQRAEEM